MIKNILLLFLFGFPLVLSAQDTIFVRTGQIIPVVIVEKNNTEIKYKKFGQPEPAAIYSVFVSDVKSIHYKDGIIADYTQAGQPSTDNKPAAPIAKAGTMNAIKFSLGGGVDYFNRNSDDALLRLWRNRLKDPNATVGGNPVSYTFLFKMNMALGNMKRNWLGDEVQFIINPSDAINATNSTGTYEIKLKNFYSNLTIYYARSLNHKNNLLATIETGLDMAFMSGYIKDDNISYNMYGNVGGGFHAAVGVDWFLSKRITASLRGGYRSGKVKAIYEDRTKNPVEFYDIWVIYPPISSQELLYATY